MPAPQLRAEIDALIRGNVSDGYSEQNTAALLRQVLQVLNASTLNVLDDAPAAPDGNTDYTAVLAALAERLRKRLTLSIAAAQDLQANSQVSPGQPYQIYFGTPDYPGSVLTLGGADTDTFEEGGWLIDENGYPAGRVTFSVPLGTYTAEGTTDNTAGTPLLDPARTTYPADFLVQYTIGGETYLFKTATAGGPFPAPPDFNGTTDWLPVARRFPIPATTATYPLDYARNVVFPQRGTQNLLYTIAGAWNNGPARTVFVRGAGGVFEGEGELLETNGTTTRVNVDVAGGTYEVGGGQLSQDIVNALTAAPGASGSNRFALFSEIQASAGVSIDADNNLIVGTGVSTGGDYNTITGGGDNAILGGINNTIQGGQSNTISGGSSNVIPSSCSGVLLLNCQQFSPPANTIDATYLNNQLYTPGGGGGTPAPVTQLVKILSNKVGTVSPGWNQIFANNGGIAGYDGDGTRVFVPQGGDNGYWEGWFVGTGVSLLHAIYAGEPVSYTVAFSTDNGPLGTPEVVSFPGAANVPIAEVYTKTGLPYGMHRIRITSNTAQGIMPLDSMRFAGYYTGFRQY